MESLVVAAFTLALASAALGPGPGMGSGPRWQFGAGDTPGWELMSDLERAEHRFRITGLQTFAECRAFVAGHYKAMRARAMDHGRALPDASSDNACQRMSRAGRLK